MTNMSINLTPIFQALIALLAALITYKLIPWIKSKTTAQQQENLRALIRVLVYAAEQMFGAGHGPDKLDYVLEKLDEMGYKVDRSEIEAAVYQAFNDMVWDDGNNIDQGGRVSDQPPDSAAESREI